MNAQLPKQSSLEIGIWVKIAKGVTDIAYDDLVLEGWTGTVAELDEDMCCVQWSEKTLKRMPEAYRQRWRGAGLPTDSVWLPKEFVETIASDKDDTNF